MFTATVGLGACCLVTLNMRAVRTSHASEHLTTTQITNTKHDYNMINYRV
jgi:uncharacterized protein (UPF0254 family)